MSVFKYLWFEYLSYSLRRIQPYKLHGCMIRLPWNVLRQSYCARSKAPIRLLRLFWLLKLLITSKTFWTMSTYKIPGIRVKNQSNRWKQSKKPIALLKRERKTNLLPQNVTGKGSSMVVLTLKYFSLARILMFG